MVLTLLHKPVPGVDDLVGICSPKNGREHFKCEAYSPGPCFLVDPTPVVEGKHEVIDMPDRSYPPPRHLQDGHGAPYPFPRILWKGDSLVESNQLTQLFHRKTLKKVIVVDEE